jgi:NAD(P)-dependent dehydrogenase (short-subunit alcohol dehydrogenase family)
MHSGNALMPMKVTHSRALSSKRQPESITHSVGHRISGHYAPPPGWIGRTLRVQWDEQHVRLLDPSTGADRCRHRTSRPRSTGDAGGSVMNIGSVVTDLNPPNWLVYTATKGAVDAVTRVLAKELGPRKIRVNSINSGVIETEGAHAVGVIGGPRSWSTRTVFRCSWR